LSVNKTENDNNVFIILFLIPHPLAAGRFIIIDGEKISFLPTKPGRFEGFIDSIPGIVEKFKSPKADKRGIAEDAEE
jgi:hypothetical protein